MKAQNDPLGLATKTPVPVEELKAIRRFEPVLRFYDLLDGPMDGFYSHSEESTTGFLRGV